MAARVCSITPVREEQIFIAARAEFQRSNVFFRNALGGEFETVSSGKIDAVRLPRAGVIADGYESLRAGDVKPEGDEHRVVHFVATRPDRRPQGCHDIGWSGPESVFHQAQRFPGYPQNGSAPTCMNSSGDPVSVIEKKNRKTVRSLYAEKDAGRGSDKRIRHGGFKRNGIDYVHVVAVNLPARDYSVGLDAKVFGKEGTICPHIVPRVPLANGEVQGIQRSGGNTACTKGKRYNCLGTGQFG